MQVEQANPFEDDCLGPAIPAILAVANAKRAVPVILAVAVAASAGFRLQAPVRATVFCKTATPQMRGR